MLDQRSTQDGNFAKLISEHQKCPLGEMMSSSCRCRPEYLRRALLGGSVLPNQFQRINWNGIKKWSFYIPGRSNSAGTQLSISHCTFKGFESEVSVIHAISMHDAGTLNAYVLYGKTHRTGFVFELELEWSYANSKWVRLNPLTTNFPRI